MNIGISIRIDSGGAARATVADIIGAADIVAGWDAAHGITLDGGNVAQWDDFSGNGFDLVQAATAEQPTFSSLGGPGQQPSVLFDVGHRMLAAGISRPAPATEPTFYWGVLKQVTWADGQWLVAFSGTTLIVMQGGGIAPRLFPYNGSFTSFSDGLPVGEYGVLETLFSGSADDYIRAGSVENGGASYGNPAPSPGFFLGGAANINIQVSEFWIFKVKPTAAQKAALRAYASARYGIPT